MKKNVLSWEDEEKPEGIQAVPPSAPCAPAGVGRVSGSGTAGKVTSCQVTVNCHYAERTLAWPVATWLYLPREWAEDAGRHQQSHVPEPVKFQTKAEIALALLDEAKASGVCHACVTGDADYGDNPQFLNGLEERGERHVVAVQEDFSVALGRSHASPGRWADAVLAEQSHAAWQTIAWSEGVKDGSAPSFWPCAAGSSTVMARATSVVGWDQSQGQPRAAFSPSPGPPPYDWR